MPVMDTIRGWFGGPQKNAPIPGSEYAPLLPLRIPATRIDFDREVGVPWMSALAMPLIGWVARTFPEAPPVVMVPKGDDDEMSADHPALELLDRPNPWQTGDELFAATLLSGIVEGNAYWIKERTNSGKVAAFYYVPHWTMAPFARNGDFLTGYIYRANGEERFYLPSDVVHFRYGLPDPNTYGRTAIGPLRAMLREVATDNEAAAFTFTALKNHGFSGGLIAPGKEVDSMTPEQRRAFKAAITEQTTGDNRGGWIVASDAYQFNVLGQSPDDMALDAIRGISETRVAAAIGVSPIVVGLKSGLDAGTYSNYDQAREAAYEQCIIPLQKAFARILTNQHLRVDVVGGERLRYSWDWSSVRCLQEDETDRVKRYVVAAGGPIMSVNEARRNMGWDAVPGQDEIRQRNEPDTTADPRSEAQKLRDRGYNDETVSRILKERKTYDVIPETEQ